MLAAATQSPAAAVAIASAAQRRRRSRIQDASTHAKPIGPTIERVSTATVHAVVVATKRSGVPLLIVRLVSQRAAPMSGKTNASFMKEQKIAMCVGSQQRATPKRNALMRSRKTERAKPYQRSG